MSDINDGKCDGHQFSKLLRLIITHKLEAVSELKHAREPDVGGFWCYHAHDASQHCDCGFDLEYFDFIQDKSVNIEMLNAVCENIERGKCVHILEREQKNEDLTECRKYISTTLLHAAAASGNAAVVKHLKASDTKRMYTPSQSGIRPFHLAIIKSQGGVLKYLYDKNDAMNAQQEYFWSRLKPAKRCSTTGCWTEIKIPDSSVYDCNVAHLLMVYGVTDKDIIRKIVDMMTKLTYKYNGLVKIYTRMSLIPTLVNLVMGKSTEIAMQILMDRHVNKAITATNTEKSQTRLITTCILVDDDKVLKALISHKLNIQFLYNGYNMLDVAMAFGSTRCASMLQQYMRPTPDACKKLSPYSFLVDNADRLPTNTDYRDLMRRCTEQGFNVNAADTETCCPPLYYAIERSPEQCMQPLLELGANVDCLYEGTTPVLLSIMWIESDFPHSPMVYYRDTGLLKYILRYNPSTELSKDALNRAIEYDLISKCMETIASSNSIKFKSIKTIGGKDVYANTLDDRFLAASAYAILHELGFSSIEMNIDFIQKQIEFAEKNSHLLGQPLHKDRLSHCEAYRDYVLKTTQNPRSLKSSCRIALRKAHPDRRLSSYIYEMKLPNTLVNYVLYPYFLWPIDVEGSTTVKDFGYAARMQFNYR